ncbi:MAG: NAD-dependent epimerase/dehydratase family protein [bacterium]
MRVLITGHDGYIGRIVAPTLRRAGHDIVGIDSFLFDGCDFGDESSDLPALRMDVRDVEVSHLEGFDAIVHLAAISNDPMGDLDPKSTYAVNHRASVRLAHLAKQAGVSRFVFSSSCSLYGAADPNSILSESAPFNPTTPYARSKVHAERDISELADDDFSPTSLRNATVYGASPRLRVDLVVNDLVASAYTTGEVLIKSDGTPWRPHVHVDDVANAVLASLEAPRDVIHDQAFNIGRTDQNYQIRDVAQIVADVVPRSRVVYAEGGGPDKRCYRVDFSKAEENLPGFEPRWTVRRGVVQLYEAYRRNGLTADQLVGSRFVRLRRIRELHETGRLGPSLRWRKAAAEASA